MREYNYLTYEYRNNKFVVHGWSVYEKGSVLEGQEMKCFLDSFDTIDQIKESYPEAKASHPMLQAQNTFDHLPDDGDY